MALMNYSFQCRCFLAPSFIHCFRNVMKLNNSTIKYKWKLTNVIFSRQFSEIFLPTLKTNSLCYENLQLFSRNYSRWTKFSRGAFYVNTNRKKNRRTQFAEEIRIKFQSQKLKETKRRVKKTIVEIKENILTIPNGLCVIRIISTPVLAYFVVSEFYTASLGLFIFAGFTDLIDGYIARNFSNQQSMIGSFLDPAADKLLIATLFVALTVNGLIPVPLTSMIILRDACLMGAGFYIRYVSLPPPKTLSRYFDMSFVTAKLQPTAISKANTLIQLSLAAASLAAPVFSFVDHFCLHALWYITGTTTVLSAASYIYYKKSTYKLFNLRDKNNK